MINTYKLIVGKLERKLRYGRPTITLENDMWILNKWIFLV
jgi:hypothetical protein